MDKKIKSESPSAFPISLDSKERKKLAKAARELAMECLTNGPEMQNAWCGCSVGLSLKRAGLWEQRRDAEHDAAQLDAWFSGFPTTETERFALLTRGAKGILSCATRVRLGAKYPAFYPRTAPPPDPAAVVFPLLAFADALEEVSSPRTPDAGGEDV